MKMEGEPVESAEGENVFERSGRNSILSSRKLPSANAVITEPASSAPSPARDAVAADLVLAPDSEGEMEEAVVAAIISGTIAMVCFHDSGDMRMVPLHECEVVVPLTLEIDDSGNLPSVMFENKKGRALTKAERDAHMKECKKLFAKYTSMKEQNKDVEADEFYIAGCRLATMYNIHQND